MNSDLQVPFMAKATFLIEGFAALIAWNSILTAFDSLHLCYPAHDVAFTLTIPDLLRLLYLQDIPNHDSQFSNSVFAYADVSGVGDSAFGVAFFHLGFWVLVHCLPDDFHRSRQQSHAKQWNRLGIVIPLPMH